MLLLSFSGVSRIILLNTSKTPNSEQEEQHLRDSLQLQMIMLVGHMMTLPLPLDRRRTPSKRLAVFTSTSISSAMAIFRMCCARFLSEPATTLTIISLREL